MQFIARRYARNLHLLLVPAYHLAERASIQNLPDQWSASYCGKALNYKKWEVVDIDPCDVLESEVCGACLSRLAVHGIDIGLAQEVLTDEHTSSG